MSPDDRLVGKEEEYGRVGLGFIGGGREGLGLGFTVLQNRIAHNRRDILKVEGLRTRNLHAEEERCVCVPEDSPSSHL